MQTYRQLHLHTLLDCCQDFDLYEGKKCASVHTAQHMACRHTADFVDSAKVK